MTRLGVIARCDDGGLGSLTVEYARHLAPDAIAVVMVDPPRGKPRIDRVAGWARDVVVVHHPDRTGDAQQWVHFLDACDVVLTAETWYTADLPRMAAARGVRLVVHAMPELWRAAPVDVWVPTEWAMDRMPPGSMVVPAPVDRGRLPPREMGDRVRRVLFVGAPAMLDRHGQGLVELALPHCRADFELVVTGDLRPTEPTRNGRVRVTPRGPVRDYWQLYDDIDALVIPRRYGGLSLPMQEAAAKGVPIVSLDLDPQRAVLHPDLLVRARPRRRATMKGGVFDVYECDPLDLAATLDRLVTEDPGPWVKASETWADALDWRRWEPRYNALLRMA